jgi:hypothetical protein
MKKHIILIAALAALSASAEPIRIRNERAAEERAERAAIRTAATEAVAELIRQNRLPPEKAAAVAPLFPAARPGAPLKTGDVVVVDGKIGVVIAPIPVDADSNEIIDAIEIKIAREEKEPKSGDQPDIELKDGGK